MRNRMYGGVRGRKTKVGEKLHRFPPTRFYVILQCISLGKERFDVLGTSPDEIAEIYFDIVELPKKRLLWKRKY